MHALLAGRRLRAIVRGVVGVCLVAVTTGACGNGSAAGSSAPAAAAPAVNAASDAPTKLDMQALFPPGEGRELVLNNCQTCHNFAPILTLQMDKEQWARNSLEHRERVNGLSDAEFKSLYQYVSSNFNPEHPVPKLPKEMLESWTSY